ncbi:MAG: nucleoside triphosphate pyrophosphohydrolase family protein [Comamonadaceae bacterium]|nr:nucleoside triphosphate pyrophosphohydrolase family protein [Comamonadaceae bacterium]
MTVIDTLGSILAWQQRACPKPDERSRSVAVGVHLEEIAEMLWGLSLNRQGDYIEAVADSFKRHSSGATDVLATYDRRALLDALCDQIVTAVGIAHRFGFDIQGALAEVARSNWSKCVDGQFQYDANGIAQVLQDLGLAFAETLCAVALFLLILVLRSLLLLTAPVSVPLLAWWLHKRAAQVRQMRAQARKELLNRLANNEKP